MKKILFSMLAMAAMVSCTSENDPIDEVKDQGIINLSAGVDGISTKVAIASDASLSAFSNMSVSLVKVDETSGTPITWTTISDKTTTAINGGDVTLTSEQKYYDKTSGKNAYFVGYYPDANIALGVVEYRAINGVTDILCTDKLDAGNKNTPTPSPNLLFKHMLAQVQIKVVGDKAAQDAFGKITKITLNNIPNEATLTIGEIPTLVKKSGSSSTTSIILYDDNTGQALEATAENIGSIPMLVPGLGTSSDKLNLSITTEKGNTSTVSVENITSGLQSGMKHIITLSFKEKITVTASIDNWGNGGTGSGEVE